MVCWLFVGSYIFSSVFGYLGGQGVVEEFVKSLPLNTITFLLLAQAIGLAHALGRVPRVGRALPLQLRYLFSMGVIGLAFFLLAYLIMAIVTPEQ